MSKIYYFDGHYPAPTQTLEEIEEELKKLMTENKNLTDWQEVD
jgi:hypothetical protein